MITAPTIEKPGSVRRSGAPPAFRIASRSALFRSLPLGLLLNCLAADAQDAVGELFTAVAREIPAAELRLLLNLNDREASAGRPDPPRLGGFADLPPGEYPDSAEIGAWEAAHGEGAVGGLVLHSDSVSRPVKEGGVSIDDRTSRDHFLEWTGTDERNRLRNRIFVTYSSEDRDLAALLDRSARAAGYDTVSLAPGSGRVAEFLIGGFYATAQHRLAIDSRAARRLRTDVTELELLGQRARRNSPSVFRDPDNRDDRGLSRREPEIFRKTTLGDEFNQPTIEEIIVPGGIALGESAKLDFTPVELVFSGETFGLSGSDIQAGDVDYTTGSFSLRGLDPVAGAAVVRQLPDDDPKLLKSLFDLAQRSTRTRSDAIVDLDADRRVRISSALRDTDAGYDMIFADTRPFEYLDYLPVIKSVIIDTEVIWSRGGLEESSPLRFETGFEVRFLAADRMRIAQTRLALAYDYDSSTGAVNYRGNWGRDGSRLREGADADGLGDELADLARYAGWLALFRRLEEQRLPFLRGRYEFMKIDKSGRETPNRFR